MRELLSNTLKRQLDFMERISRHLVKIDTLPWNRVTLKSDVQIINQYIFPLQIINNEGAYELLLPKNYSFSYVYGCVFNESMEFNVLEEIFFHEGIKIDVLAQKCFVSESTARRVVTRINRQMRNQQKQVQILIQDNEVFLEGAEEEIVLWFTRFFIEKYDELNKSPFSKRENESVEYILRYLARSLNVKHESYDVLVLMRNFILVNMYRLGKCSQLTIPNEIESVTYDELSEHTPNFLFLSTAEKKELLYRLTMLIDYFKIGKEEDEQPVENNSKLLQQLKTTSSVLASNFHVAESNPELAITIHDNIKVKRLMPYLLHNPERDFFSSFYEYNPQKITTVIETIEERISMIDDEEKYSIFFAFVVGWEELGQELMNKSKQLHLGIAYDSSTQHSQLIKSKISSLFSECFRIDIIDYMNISDFERISEEYDLVVSNKSNLAKEEKMVCMSYYPKIEELVGLYQRYLRIINA